MKKYFTMCKHLTGCNFCLLVVCFCFCCYCWLFKWTLNTMFVAGLQWEMYRCEIHFGLLLWAIHLQYVPHAPCWKPNLWVTIGCHCCCIQTYRSIQIFYHHYQKSRHEHSFREKRSSQRFKVCFFCLFATGKRVTQKCCDWCLQGRRCNFHRYSARSNVYTQMQLFWDYIT